MKNSSRMFDRLRTYTTGEVHKACGRPRHGGPAPTRRNPDGTWTDFAAERRGMLELKRAATHKATTQNARQKKKAKRNTAQLWRKPLVGRLAVVNGVIRAEGGRNESQHEADSQSTYRGVVGKRANHALVRSEHDGHVKDVVTEYLNTLSDRLAAWNAGK